jgi:hypothetical protein
VYVDKLLKGATAQALGLTLPPAFLARAETVLP